MEAARGQGFWPCGSRSVLLALQPPPASRPRPGLWLQDQIAAMRRKLEAIGRELGSVTEAEYASLAAALPPSARPPPQPSPPVGSVVVATPLPPGTPVPAAVQIPAPPPPAVQIPLPAPPPGELQQNIVPISPRLTQPKKKATPEGTGREIMLQVGGDGGKGWAAVLECCAVWHCKAVQRQQHCALLLACPAQHSQPRGACRCCMDSTLHPRPL